MTKEYYTVSSKKIFESLKKQYVKRGWKCTGFTSTLATFVKGENEVTIVLK